jgi:hypothetical protein
MKDSVLTNQYLSIGEPKKPELTVPTLSTSLNTTLHLGPIVDTFSVVYENEPEIEGLLRDCEGAVFARYSGFVVMTKYDWSTINKWHSEFSPDGFLNVHMEFYRSGGWSNRVFPSIEVETCHSLGDKSFRVDFKWSEILRITGPFSLEEEELEGPEEWRMRELWSD